MTRLNIRSGLAALGLALALLIIAPVPTPGAQAEVSGVTPHCGDANADGIVNSLDASLVLQYVAGLIDSPAPPQQLDPDGNGRIDAVDVLLILQANAHRFHVRDFRCPI